LAFQTFCLEVPFLWKDTNPQIDNNYAKAERRLHGLTKRLQNDPNLLKQNRRIAWLSIF